VTPGIDDRDGDLAAARALQAGLAQKVSLRDGYARPLRTIAGFVAGFAGDGATARAAAVLLDADGMELLASATAPLPARPPDAPDLLSLHALPALVLALERLPRPPDLAFVHGHGIAHPRGLGIAAHFGVATGVPAIGVADAILLGTGSEPHQVRGAYTPLRHEGRQFGWLLRSKVDRDPLVVSPGHRVSMASAADLVMRFTADERLPEPTRLAAQLLARHG